MGDAADLILDGTVDEETGELIDGESPGYPRSPTRDARRAKQWASRVKCPRCGKLCASEQGLADHAKAKHSVVG